MIRAVKCTSHPCDLEKICSYFKFTQYHSISVSEVNRAGLSVSAFICSYAAVKARLYRRNSTQLAINGPYLMIPMG